jgi:hypothetical protein
MRGRTHRLHTSGVGVPSLTPGRDGRHSSRVPLPLVKTQWRDLHLPQKQPLR